MGLAEGDELGADCAVRAVAWDAAAVGVEEDEVD